MPNRRSGLKVTAHVYDMSQHKKVFLKEVRANRPPPILEGTPRAPRHDRELCERRQAGSTMCEKHNYEGSRTFIRPLLLKGHSSQAVRNHKAHCDSKEQMGRRSRSNTRGFLRKCQPPACQGFPVVTTDRSGMIQFQAEKTGNIMQTTVWARQEHEDEKRGGKYVLPQRVEAKSNGALGVKSPLFHRTCGKTT